MADKKRRTSIYIQYSLHQRFEGWCTQTGRNFSQGIEWLITCHLNVTNVGDFDDAVLRNSGLLAALGHDDDDDDDDDDRTP